MFRVAFGLVVVVVVCGKEEGGHEQFYVVLCLLCLVKVNLLVPFSFPVVCCGGCCYCYTTTLVV